MAAAPAEAQQRRSYPCPNARTQTDLNECASAAYKAAELRMNAAYAALKRGVADTTRRHALAAAQQAWVGFRDKYCRFIASANEGGSMYPMQLGFCLAGVTDERTKQLRADLTNERL